MSVSHESPKKTSGLAKAFKGLHPQEEVVEATKTSKPKRVTKTVAVFFNEDPTENFELVIRHLRETSGYILSDNLEYAPLLRHLFLKAVVEATKYFDEKDQDND